jgi:hypothetical protein
MARMVETDSEASAQVFLICVSVIFARLCFIRCINSSPLQHPVNQTHFMLRNSTTPLSVFSISPKLIEFGGIC